MGLDTAFGALKIAGAIGRLAGCAPPSWLVGKTPPLRLVAL